MQLHQRMNIDQVLMLGVQHQQAGRLAEAEKIFRSILAVDPRHAEALHQLGILALDVAKYDIAVDLIRRALVINSSDARFYNNLGRAYIGRNEPEAAASAFRRALDLKSGYSDAHNGLGAALLKALRIEDAIQHFRKAILYQPRFPEAYSNLGAALQEIGRFEDAKTAFSQAIAIQPDCAMAHFNLGFVQLLHGDFTNGWREYEWRLRARELGVVAQQFPQPKWDGSPLDGKRILIHAEQGFGDTIQFIRFIPQVVQRGGRIFLSSPPELGRLLSNFDGVERLLIHGDSAPEFDVHCPLLSLPAIFDTTLSSIPNAVPYLQSDPVLSGRWKSRLASERRLKVGLCWAGNPTQSADHRRSIQPQNVLSELASLSDVCSFYSLQKGPASIMSSDPSLQLIDWTSELSDFAETAALIDNLDVVVSVCTSVAHLAGAMGKRTFVPLGHLADWRWLLQREDSPWYPNMRLVRQDQLGDWATPLRRTSAELRNLGARR